MKLSPVSTTMREYFSQGDSMTENRINRLEKCYDELSSAVQRLLGQTATIEMMIKWVVLPLIVIVGGLVGVKIAMP